MPLSRDEIGRISECRWMKPSSRFLWIFLFWKNKTAEITELSLRAIAYYSGLDRATVRICLSELVKFEIMNVVWKPELRITFRPKCDWRILESEVPKKPQRVKLTPWRNAVLKRDRYRCQDCGGWENLEVHHIKPWKKFPELRIVVSNGITLCKSCHKKEHGKGIKP